MERLRKCFKVVVCLAMMVGCVFTNGIPARAEERVNFALNKPVTASHNDGHGPENAVDGDLGTRWGTDPYGSNQWLRVDLGRTLEFDELRVASEASNGQKMRKFKIEGSNDDASFEMIYDSADTPAGFDFDNTIKLEEAASYRYVKVTVEKLISGAYPSVSLREFQVIGNEEAHITDVKNALKDLSVPSKIYHEFDVPTSDEARGVAFEWVALNDVVSVENGHVTLNATENKQESGLRVTASKNGYTQTLDFTFQVFVNELNEYSVYPVPQELNYGEGVLLLENKINVVLPEEFDENVKNYAQRVLEEHQFDVTFNSETKENVVNLFLGVAGVESDANAYFETVDYDKTVSTDVVEGYALSVNAEENAIAVLGHEESGVFNGLSTLAQMLDSSRSQLKDVLIEDSPNTKFRGIIEGFYGQYSHAERLDLISFIGPLKMNTYIYGAKNDPYHNGQWREPYPEKELNQIGELVQRGKENNVELVWSAHVGGHIDMGNEADYEALIAKFDQLYSVGVRQFALFYDDAYTDRTYLVEFINRVNREYINTKPGVKDLIFCPEQYCKTRVSGNYLETISNFDQDVQIMWTGDSVISEVSPSMMEYIEAKIKRPAYIWWNYPVNDLGLGNQMLVGETVGLSTEMGSMNGLVSNPMLQAQASKFSLFSIADYGWNIADYDKHASWNAGVEYIIKEKSYADAFKLFSANNNQSVAELKDASVESEYLVEVFDNFRKAYYEGQDVNEAADQVISEFKAIEDACEYLRSYHNAALISQIKPWLDQLQNYTRIGQEVVANAKNVANSDLTDSDVFASAAKQYETHQQTLKNVGGKWAARREILPFLQEVQGAIHQDLLAALGTETVRTMTNYRDGNYLESKLPELVDGIKDTGFQLDEREVAGKWFGVDLGSVQEIKDFEILVGSNETDGKVAPVYKVQVSNDSINWSDVETTEANNCITNVNTETGRFVRYYVEEGCNQNVQVREFFVNRTDKKVITNVENATNLTVNETKSAVAVEASDVTVRPNEYIGVQFDQAKKVPSITNETTLTLEYSVDNIHWTTYTEGEVTARFVRVVNTSEEAVTVDGNLFTLHLSDAVIPTDLSVEELGLSTWSGNKNQIVDGNRSSYHWTKEQKTGNGYVIDMKSEINLYDVTVVMGDGDFMVGGVVETSTDKENWVSAGTINGAKVTTVYPNTTARYIRVKMTKDHGNWLKLAEVEINQLAVGTDAPVLSDEAVANTIDKDVTTAFNSSSAGSFEFYNYEEPTAGQLNIYKNEGNITVEAFVEGEWVELEGTGTEFVTYKTDAASKFRISWDANVSIYEMGLSVGEADYSKVDEAIANVPADLTVYTEESVAALQEALDAVVRGLDSSRQAEVDEMAEAINVAVANLEKSVYTVTVNGEVFTTGKYNERVTVTAPVVEGKTFTAWLYDGKVISTDETYTFFLSDDIDLVASYEEVSVEAQALLTNTILTKRDTKADVKFVAQLVVPVGYTVENAGLVWSSKEGTDLSLENTNLKPTYINTISTSNQFSVTIKGMPAGRFIRGKIFATLVDAEGNETVVYSEETRVVSK